MSSLTQFFGGASGGGGDLSDQSITMSDRKFVSAEWPEELHLLYDSQLDVDTSATNSTTSRYTFQSAGYNTITFGAPFLVRFYNQSQGSTNYVGGQIAITGFQNIADAKITSYTEASPRLSFEESLAINRKNMQTITNMLILGTSSGLVSFYLDDQSSLTTWEVDFIADSTTAAASNLFTNARNCALNQTSIDNFFINLSNAFTAANSPPSSGPRYVRFEGGTNAAPSSASQAARTNLIQNYGFSISSN